MLAAKQSAMAETPKNSPAPVSASPVEQIDRTVEDAMGRVMNGSAQPGDFGTIGDLYARRIELTEPEAVAALEELLGVKFPRSTASKIEFD